jgi:hypothetical protein
MILQGWQCLEVDEDELDCAEIRGWGAAGYPAPDKDRRRAMLNCAKCKKVTMHAYLPGHTIGADWREFRRDMATA